MRILCLCVTMIFGGALVACQDQQPQPSNARFGPPSTLDGMGPSSGMGGFTGTGSWGPGNPSLDPPGVGPLKNFRGF